MLKFLGGLAVVGIGADLLVGYFRSEKSYTQRGVEHLVESGKKILAGPTQAEMVVAHKAARTANLADTAQRILDEEMLRENISKIKDYEKELSPEGMNNNDDLAALFTHFDEQVKAKKELESIAAKLKAQAEAAAIKVNLTAESVKAVADETLKAADSKAA